MRVLETMLGDRTRARLAGIREYLYGSKASTTGKVIRILVPEVIYGKLRCLGRQDCFRLRVFNRPGSNQFYGKSHHCRARRQLDTYVGHRLPDYVCCR
jgi:hypothetical protein